MLGYFVRRLLLAAVTVWAITVVTFVIIQLPPGDFVDAYVAQSAAMGSAITMEEAAALRQAYGLDEPLLVQYVKWVGLIARGEFGVSFEFGRPVSEVIGDRFWLTILISILAIVVTWGIALPIGIYSAVRQYSWGDYFFTFIGFIGLAVPNFLLALIIMYLAFRWFGLNVGGLFSAEFELAPWSAGQGLGSRQASPAAGPDPGAGRHRPAGQDHAREPAGRVAQALCGHRPGQGAARSGA